MKHYNTITKTSDPEMTIKLPETILRDLVLRAEENGNTVEMEFANRLARSLERDLEMVEQDNAYAHAAFEMLHKI